MTLRARDVAEIGENLGLERFSVTVMQGWDFTPQFVASFGPPAYRQIVELSPSLDADAVKAKLEAARASPLVEAPSPTQEATSQPAATPAPAKGKRKAAPHA